MSKSMLLVGSAFGALAFAGAAFAQPASTAAQATSETQQTGAVEMGGVVITAERRDANLQDVPVAVTAFTDESRAVLGVATMQDFTNFTPGLVYSSGTDRISIRGIGRLTNVQAADPGVANYVDGVYTSSALDASRSPLFIQRVEILRGPQGTLYGRNSIGGALNTISVRPTHDWYAEVRATAANYGRYVGEGAISGPITDGLQFRLGGSYENQSEGWYHNAVVGGQDAGGIVRQWFVEGAIQFQVGHFDGYVRALTANWSNQGGGPGANRTFSPDPWTNASRVFNGPAGLTVNPLYGLSGLPTIVPGSVNNNGVTTNPNTTDRYAFANDTPTHAVLDNVFELTSEFIYHFDNVDVKYILGGETYHYRLDQDLDGTAVTSFTIAAANGNPNLTIFPQYPWTYQEEKSWYSNEIDIASTDDGPFQWIVGGYQYHEEYNQPVYTTLPLQAQVATPATVGILSVCAAPGFAYNATFTGVVPNGTCTNTGQVFGTVAAAPNPNRRLYDDRPHLEDDSWAVFGQFDWHFTDEWTLTAGLRYSSDHKQGIESVRVLCAYTATCVGPLAGLVNPVQSGATLPVFDITQAAISFTVPTGVTGPPTCDPATGFCSRNYDFSWTAVTGTLGIQFQPDESTLIYLRYARGYKAGGFNVGIGTALGAFPWTDAEHNDSYELGLKRNWGRVFQVNAAIYYYNYTNAQAPVTVANNTGGTGVSTSRFFNIPEAISVGLELETIWSPIPDLQILFNYSLNDAHITRACCIVDPADPTAINAQASPSGPASGVDTSTGGLTQGQDLRGNHLPNAPLNKISLNVNYTWHFEPGDLTASMSYIWRDVQYGEIFSRTYNRSPAWDQTDARMVFRGAQNRYTVIAYVRNVFDETTYSGGASGGRVGNGNSATGGVLSPLGIASAYPTTIPRTFGVEVQYRFF